MRRPTATNPVHPTAMADPFVLKWAGTYYAFGTGGVSDGRIFPVLRSPDLIRWTFLGGAMDALPGADPGLCWAPEVTYRNGVFYLYYAAVAYGKVHHIRVATSRHPAGPYLDTGRDLTSRRHSWAIDAHPFLDEDGQAYLFYTVEMTHEGRTGVGNVVDRLATPFELAGAPQLVTPPCAEWHEYERSRAEKGGVDWYCVEGPCVVKRAGRYYHMYSGGNYQRPNYSVGYATATAMDSPWQQWAPPGAPEPGRILQTRSARLYGPGHHSVTLGPNNVDRYICYHAWEPDRAARRMCLDRMEFHGDRLFVDGPNPGVRPAPRQPWFRQAAPVQVGAHRLFHHPLPQEALIEVNFRVVEGEGRLGLQLAPGLPVWFELPDGADPGVFHQALLQVDRAHVTLWLDGVKQPARAAAARSQGPWGLLTAGAVGEFAGVTVTAHLEDLIPARLRSGLYLRGEALPAYEAQVDLEAGAQAGLCAWAPAAGPKALVVVRCEGERWFLVTALEGGPEQLDPLDGEGPYSIRTVKQGETLEVYLDGQFRRILDLPHDAPGSAGPVVLADEAVITGFRRTGFQ